jgi:hypothetical protein
MSTSAEAEDDRQRAEALAAAAAAIAAAEDVPAPLREQLQEHLDAFIEKRHVRLAAPPGRPGGLGVSHWAVRDDALDLTKSLSTSANALAAFTFAATGNVWVLATALIVAAIDVATRLRRKHVVLDADASRVLMALRHCGPVPVETLVLALNYLNVVGPAAMSQETVDAALRRLSEARGRDGTAQPLAVLGTDGCWSANGV